jgi:DNA-binding NarL/FixJ family response regulator
MNSDGRIRVLVAEDNEDLSAALQALVAEEADLDCVGSASSIPSLCEAGARLAPQVVVLDVELEGESSVRNLPRILEACPGSRVVMYSGHVHPAIVRGALEAGATAYVAKNGDFGELLTAIRKVSTAA